MKTKYVLLFVALFFVCCSSSILAQDDTMHNQNNCKPVFEHQLVAGFNIGATAPISLPQEIRQIDAYWPQFTPQLGYNATYRFSPKCGIGSGILLDYKGMGTNVKVKSLYTIVDVKSGEEIGSIEGYFTGKNKTEVKSAYITIPLYFSYKFNDEWNARVGGYGSYRFSSEFSGNVTDGYMREGDPTGERIDIDIADFNFGDEMHFFDFGLILGTEYSVNNRFGLFANMSWGLTPVFPSSFKGVDYNLYNIYGTFGLTYHLK